MIDVVGHGLAALLFAILVPLAWVGQVPERVRPLLLAALALTALWALAGLHATLSGAEPVQLEPLVAALALARDVGWLAFLGVMLAANGATGSGGRLVAAGIAVAALLLLAGLLATLAPEGDLGDVLGDLGLIGRVLTPVVGMVLVENLYRNAGRDGRWAVKMLAFGIGGIFAYDFYFAADVLLLHRIDSALASAQPFVYALGAPLIGLSVRRGATWTGGVSLSRRLVVYSAAVVGSGIYLVTMASAGIYLRSFGGTWSSVLQVVFLVGAALILFVVFSSATARSTFRVLIEKHLFAYKYDYRDEWLRFIATISGGAEAGGLHDRILRAIADIVDSPAGLLLSYRAEDKAFFPSAAWNFADPEAGEPADAPLARFLAETHWILEVSDVAARPEAFSGLVLPDWLRNHPRAWLVVPLVHLTELKGILVLGRPRAQRTLNWEDYDLLRTIGRQAASYLAEEAATAALSDSRGVEDFNRRFAFVVHDVKNLVSQLSLMLRNAQKHADDPEFQKDMLNTVENSVARMTALLGQLGAAKADATRSAAQGGDAPQGAAAPAIDLADLVRDVGARWARQHGGLAASTPGVPVPARVTAGAVVSVLDHLIQNACDAAGPDGHVALRLSATAAEAVIEVQDDGPGMDEVFIRDRLFRPLHSTKRSGSGIGAWQARQLVRDLGGRLDVASEIGVGTTFRVSFALAEPAGASPGPAHLSERVAS